MRKERKRHDRLALRRAQGRLATVGREVLFYAFEHKQSYKNGLSGLAWLFAD
jgi:hypothetical protein